MFETWFNYLTPEEGFDIDNFKIIDAIQKLIWIKDELIGEHYVWHAVLLSTSLKGLYEGQVVFPIASKLVATLFMNVWQSFD